jgi:tetratricopeptide (TPR) repeat protein
VALSDDLVRYRTGRPITARPPSRRYRVRKFVGRNRVAVAAGTAAIMGLAGGLALALHQAGVAREERDVAQAVSAFMENLFTASDPFEESAARLDTLRIGVYLERAAHRLDADLATQPELRARMQGILGSVLSSVGLHDRARGMLEASLVGYRTLNGEASPEVGRTLERLGRVQRSGGDPAGAETSYRRALAIHQRRSAEPAEAAGARAGLAVALMMQDRLDEADELLHSLVEAGGEAETPAEVIDHLNMLAALLYRQGRVDESIVNLQRAVSLSRDLLGTAHPGTATLTHNLGMALHRRGSYAEAESVLRDAWAALDGALGPDHPAIGVTMKALANVLDATDRWAEADTLYHDAVVFTRRAAGSGTSQDLTIALHDYGGALARHGELERARPLLEEALDLERTMLGAGSPGAGIIMISVGDLQRRQGDAAAAERTHREALAILGRAFPPTHSRVLAARSALGLSLGDLGHIAEAESMLMSAYNDAVTVADGGTAARHAAGALARFYEARGNAGEATRWQTESAELRW